MDRNYKQPPDSPFNIILGKERAVHTKVHGLFTALGSFWEKLVKELAPHNGFDIGDQKIFKVPKNAPTLHKSTIDGYIASRISGSNEYDAETSKQAVSNLCNYYAANPCEEWDKPPRGTGVDVYLKKGGRHYLFDSKTVKPNLEHLNTFLRELHMWYWYAYSRFPGEDIFARIVFPYNPHNTLFEENIFGGGRPLHHKLEWLDPKRFWELITGNPNADSLIMECFNKLVIDSDLNDFLKEIFPETRR